MKLKLYSYLFLKAGQLRWKIIPAAEPSQFSIPKSDYEKHKGHEQNKMKRQQQLPIPCLEENMHKNNTSVNLGYFWKFYIDCFGYSIFLNPPNLNDWIAY